MLEPWLILTDSSLAESARGLQRITKGRSRSPLFALPRASPSSGVPIKAPFLVGTWSATRIFGYNLSHRKMCLVIPAIQGCPILPRERLPKAQQQDLAPH